MEDFDDSCGRRRATVSFDTNEGGRFTVSFDAPQRHTPRDDETFISDTTVDGGRQRSGSARSVGSLETDVLLKDTPYVAQAISERIQQRNPVSKASDSVFRPIVDDTDSDASSTACIIDGDLDTPRTPPPAPRGSKPRLPKSKGTDKSPVPRTTPTRRGDSYTVSSQRRDRGGSSSSAGRSELRRNKSVTEYDESDGYTDSSSIVSTDYSYCESLGSPKMARRSSSGKGKTPTIRPNRTFELRRSRTEDANDTETSTTLTGRSRPSSAGGSIDSARSSTRSRSNSRTRPSSGRDSSRTAGTDRSEVSLGQKIVKKSRDNNVAGSGRAGGTTSSKSFVRGDGGRHSLRASQQPALSSGSSSSRASSNTRRRDNNSATRNTASPRSPGLAVTGNRPIDHRSNSPRSAEASAWKRRKDYDPRKAVAEAKAGSRRDTSGSRHGSAGSSKLRSNRSRSVTEEQAGGRRRRRGAPDAKRSQSSISSEEPSLGDSSRSEDIASFSRTVADDLNALTRETESESEYFQSFRRVG